MAKKKILYVHHDGSFSGAPKSLSYLIKNLDQSKYEPLLMNIVDGPVNEMFETLPCELIIPKKGIRPFHGSYVVQFNLYNYLYGWFFLLPSVFIAYRKIKKIKPTLIHLNSTCLFAIAIAAFFLKVKTVCHVREPIRKGWPGWPLRFFNKAFVSGFIAISQFDLDSLKLSKRNRTPRVVIYNFVDKFYKKQESLDSSFRQEIGINKNDILFLYLARFTPFNGWKELIEMAGEVVEKNHNAHFVLVGATQEEHFIDTASDKIHIVSFRHDIENILRTSDVFICPFVAPHFARGIIESAAFNIPSIGHNIGGVNELIVDGVTGFLYQSKKDFFFQCQTLIDNKYMLISLGNSAYQFAKEHFNSYKNLKQTYLFYKNITH